MHRERKPVLKIKYLWYDKIRSRNTEEVGYQLRRL